jgi:hypothetical protein
MKSHRHALDGVQTVPTGLAGFFEAKVVVAKRNELHTFTVIP